MKRPNKEEKKFKYEGEPFLVIDKSGGKYNYELRIYVFREIRTLGLEVFSLKKKKVVDRDRMQFGEMEDLVGEGLQ